MPGIIEVTRRKITMLMLATPALIANSLDAQRLTSTLDVSGARGSNPGDLLIEIPSDSRVINVRSYGAKGDGITDDTNAIRRAFKQIPPFSRNHPWFFRIIYFPIGTYCVSDTLAHRDSDGLYQPQLVLMGQSRERSVIKLIERSAGFGDADSPKAVICTASGLKFTRGGPTEGGRDYLGRGEGNEAFGNIIENLTVLIGEGNPGAIGIDYLGNNIAAIRGVTIKASERGAVGLSMTRRWPGPISITDLAINCFDIGIDVAHTQYSITLDNVQIIETKLYGLRNNGNVISFHKLEVETLSGCGIANLLPEGMIVGIEGRVTGVGSAAILNYGIVSVKNVSISGFLEDGLLARPAYGEGVYREAAWLSSTVWALPIRDIPRPKSIDRSEWVSVLEFGAISDPGFNSTDAFLRAFASNARVVYIPNGIYAINQEITISDNVERIEGFYSIIVAGKNSRPYSLFNTNPSRQNPLFIRRLAIEKSGNVDVIIRHCSRYTLILTDIASGAALINRTAEGGEVFTENTNAQVVYLAGNAPAWFRQFDTEGQGVRIYNDGAPLWILGVKTEGIATLLQNTCGANTEIVGGLIYRVRPGGEQVPLLINNNSRLIASYAEEALSFSATYAIHAISNVAGKQSTIISDNLPLRSNYSRFVPHLSILDN